MNPGRFYLPNMVPGMGSMIRTGYFPARGGVGFFSKITNSLRGFNWSGLLNGANKTLNVVNQTIPLVRQAGPMFNNMKSMLRIARAFGSETTSKKHFKDNNISFSNSNSNVHNSSKDSNNAIEKKEVLDSNYPNFFI